MKIRVLWPGKTRKSYYRDALEDYASRIRKLTDFEVVETREDPATDRKRAARIRKESAVASAKLRAPSVVLLDTEGKQVSSTEFAEWLRNQAGDVDFVVGGPAGMRLEGPVLKLSLGRITLPHELARVVLLEQVYRALTILKRIPYHK